MNWSGEDAKVKKIADALFDADCIEAYFVSQNGHPSGEPSDSWTLAQLQKYCDNRNITHYPEAVDAVEAVEAVEEVLWAEGDELPEGVEVGDVKTEAVEGVDAVEAKAKDTKASLLSAIAE